MITDYNLLKHVYLSCETLLNIAEIDPEEDEVRENLVKHRLHIKSDPRDLIATTKFVTKYGFFPPKDVPKLLENVNLSSDQLFHLMLLFRHKVANKLFGAYSTKLLLTDG